MHIHIHIHILILIPMRIYVYIHVTCVCVRARVLLCLLVSGEQALRQAAQRLLEGYEAQGAMRELTAPGRRSRASGLGYNRV